MAAARLAALLHHAAYLAGQIRQQVLLVVLLFVKQAGDVGGAKLVGIAAERGELGQANFTGQDAAVGEARVGRQIGGRQRRVEVAKALERRQQQDVRGGRLCDAGAGLGGEPGGFQGADGGQPLMVALLAKQGQPLLVAVALQIREARLYVGQPHLAVGVIRMGGHKGGQGGARVAFALQQIHRAGGEVQGALAGGHQQGLLARLGQTQGRRQACHAAAYHDSVKFHGCTPWLDGLDGVRARGKGGSLTRWGAVHSPRPKSPS
ncbi:hypothetical protein D3C87_1270740 [compost metagenome]